MRKLYFCCLVLSIGAFSQTISAQNTADTSFRSIAIKGLIDLYHKTVNVSSALYNGTSYEAHYPVFEPDSHPFFKENNFYLGSVRLEGIVYENIPLIYDIVREELVLKHANAVSWQVLVKDKIDWFMLQGYKFIRLDKYNELDLSEGLYNELYAGNLTLLAKHEKIKNNIIVERRIMADVSEKTNYYVVKNGKANLVKNKKDVLTLLGDKRSALTQYIRKNHLNFKKEKERSMTQTITYYDQLTHS